MVQNSESQSLQAFDLLRQAAREYNGAEFKFYYGGFFKYVREGNTFLIEDIYIEPEYRGTALSSLILNRFEAFMREEGIVAYYGRVFFGSKDHDKRVETFKKWGMTESCGTSYYTTVSKLLEY